jgi:hypothetical protein
LAAVASAALACGALRRAFLAAQHYRVSCAIRDDPSAKELEQVSALFEGGFALVLLGHALAAASYTRRPFRLNGAAVLGIAAVAGTTIGGSLAKVPVPDTPGLVSFSLLLACGLVGYSASHAWASVYLGVVLGGVAASALAAPELRPLVVLAIVVPPVCVGLVGVGLGRLARRALADRRAA